MATKICAHVMSYRDYKLLEHHVFILHTKLRKLNVNVLTRATCFNKKGMKKVVRCNLTYYKKEREVAHVREQAIKQRVVKHYNC